MSPKQRAQNRIIKNKRVGLFELDKTFESLLTNALIHSKVCKDDVSVNSLLEKLYNDPRTEKYAKKIEGGYRFRLNKLIKEVEIKDLNKEIDNLDIKDLKENDLVSIEIKEKNGSLIKRYNNKAKLNNLNPESDLPLTLKSGGNKLIWDMRYPGYKEFEGMVFYSSPNKGPKAIPGEYLVSLNYNGEVIEQPLEIVKDPRLANTDKDYKDQFDFLINVRNQVSRANSAIIKIREVQKDLNYLKQKSGLTEEINNLINQFENKLSLIENNIHMTKNQSRQDPLNFGIRINNRIAFLLADSQRGDYPPTNQAIEFFNQVKKELDSAIINLDEVVKNHSTRINNYVKEKNIELISFDN